MSVRFFFGGWLFLLVWTMGVHVVTFLALPFSALFWAFGLAASAGGLGAARPVEDLGLGELRLPAVRFEAAADGRVSARRIPAAGVLCFVFLATAGFQYKVSNSLPFWAACVAIGLVALWRPGWLGSVLPVRFEPQPAQEHGGRDAVFLAVAAATAAFYLFTSVPDTDDSLFLNFAVGAKEAREAVFSHDTMLGLEGLSFIKSTYRLESYQLMAAILSDASGWPVVFVAHTILPVAMCIWSVSALVLIHTALFPRIFLVTLGLNLLLLVALDGSLQSFGYHAIPRYFHGKAPFVTVMIPLIAVLTVAVLRTGSWRALLLLVGSIVISVGFTANAVYAGPLCAALLGLTFLIAGGQARWRALRLVLIVIYPASLVMYLLLFDPPSASEHTSAGTLGQMLWGIFGRPSTMLLGLAAIFLGVCLPFLHRSLAICGVYTLVVLLVVLNPLLWSFYGEYVTGNINHRLFWAIPIPLLATILLGLLWTSRVRGLRLAVAAVVAAGLVGPGSILRQADTGLAFYKVPEPEFRLAQRLVNTLKKDELLLAPEEISAWVTVLEDAPAVVEGRAIYSPQREDPNYGDALKQRAELFVFWSTPTSDDLSADAVGQYLEALGVSAILLDTQRPHHARLAARLMRDGYAEVWTDGAYRLLNAGT